MRKSCKWFEGQNTLRKRGKTEEGKTRIGVIIF